MTRKQRIAALRVLSVARLVTGKADLSNIYAFKPRTARCAQCGKRFVLRGPSPVDAYCHYSCGADAQPGHTAAVKMTTTNDRP